MMLRTVVRSVACRLSRKALRLAVKFLALPRVRWYGSEPVARQRVYFFNHSSHADTVIIWASLPKAVRALAHPLAAQDYWTKNALRRFFAKNVLQAIYVDRQPRNDEERQAQVERVLDSMGPQACLLMAPEGTRGEGDLIQPFKSGLYHLCARKSELELVPVLLRHTHRLLPKGSYLPRPVSCQVTFGPPLRLLPGESKEEFLMRARDSLLQLDDAPGQPSQ